MKKQTNKKLYWLIPMAWVLIVVLLYLESNAGVYNNSGTSSEDSICFAGVNISADGRRLRSIATSDSLYVLCFYPGGALAFRDSLQMNNSKVTIAAFEDDARVGAFTYKNAVADIDGGGQNGVYKIVYSLIDIDSQNVSWRVTEAQVYATANYSTALDSAIVDRSSLSIYAGNFQAGAIDAAAIAADAIGSSELATDAIGATEIAADAIGASEIATNAIARGTEASGFYNPASDSVLVDGSVLAGLSNAISSTTIAADAIGASEIADGAIDSAAFSSSAKTGLAFYVWNSATRTLTSAGSGGITEAEMWDMLDTAFVRAFRDAMGDTFATWSDSATVDRSSLVIVAGNFGSGAIDAAAIAANAIGSSEIADGAIDAGSIATDAITDTKIAAGAITSSEIAADAIGSSELAADAIGASEIAADAIGASELAASSIGASELADAAIDSNTFAADAKKMIAIRSDSGAVGGGGSGWDGYPFLERVAIVDGVGSPATRLIVIDSTTTGGSNESGLVNRAITIRDTDDGKWYAQAIIERVNCDNATGLCTLQTSEALPFSAEAGDSVWLWGAGPSYVFATLAEASAQMSDSVVQKDLTDMPQDSLLAGLIKAAAYAVGFDSTEFLVLANNHGWKTAWDTLTVRMVKGTNASLPLLSQLYTEAEFEAFDMNVAKIKGSSTLVIDTARNAASGGGGGDCSGSGAYACTLYVMKSSTAQQSVLVKVRNSAETATEAEGYTDPDGKVVFNLDAYASYKARIYRAGLSQTTNPQTVPVTSSGANDTILVTEVPIGPTTALFSMNLLSPFFRNAEVRYTLTQASGDIAVDTSANVVIPTVLYDKADTSGVIATALYKNSSIYLMKKKTTGATQWNVKVRQRGSGTWDNAPIDLTVFIPADSTYFRTTGGM